MKRRTLEVCVCVEFFPASILPSVNNGEKWPLPRHKMGLFVYMEKLNKPNMLNHA